MAEHFDHVPQADTGDPKREITPAAVITTQHLAQGARRANACAHGEQVSPGPTKSLRTAIQPQITVQPRLGIDRQAFLWEPCVIAKTINASRIANADGANIHAVFQQLRP